MRLVSSKTLGSSRILALVAIVVFICFLYSQRDLAPHGIPFFTSHFPVTQATDECPLNVQYLKNDKWGLKKDIIFHKQCIRAVANDDVDRSFVSDAHDDIFGQSQELDLAEDCQAYRPMPCEEHITLEVPSAYPAESYKELLFGVATSFDRLVDSLPQLSHWLGNSGARLVACVADAPDHEQDLGRLTDYYQSYGVELIIVQPTHLNLDVNRQHFTIIRDLLEYSTPDTEWVGIIDDDTFFPSLHPISEVLADQDHTVPAYLGSISEDMHAIQTHGLLAYGGAGVFLSMPLMRQLEPVIDTCLTELNVNSNQGDALLKNCIYAHSEARLTIVAGLYQLDFMGDPSGFYESGRFPLSLHHWKSWHNAPVDMMAKAAKFCGGCFLQRWRFGEDTVLSNGYSLAVYYDGISHDELGRTEGTMNYPHQYDWSWGPMRPKTEELKKKSYFLVESEHVENSLKQVYIHRGGNGKDEVLELWWEL